MADETEKPFAEWIGRTSEAEDVVTERLAASFRAIFAPNLAPVAQDAAPLGLHWCLTPPIAPMAELGPDGHPARNRDLPPVPLPRRMWAGGSIETFGGLRIGDRVRRVSAIADVARKRGRTGELWFVSIGHDYLTDRGLAIRERQDIVYREAALPSPAGASAHVREDAGPKRVPSRTWTVETSPTLLFRYSAVTFNGHRIHHDLPYATRVEGYRDLVVHGPMQATLLLNLASEGGTAPGRFDYRAVSPAIAGDALSICAGEGNTFWTHGPSGQVHMEMWAAGP